jgi:hypothetical protein
VRSGERSAASRAHPSGHRAVDPARRRTLVARGAPEGLLHDIRLQGPAETVFFAV